MSALLSKEESQILKKLFSFVLFGFLSGYIITVNNPVKYVCSNKSMPQDQCYADCAHDKLTCLRECGCTEISTEVKNPISYGIYGGLLGISAWAIIESVKQGFGNA